MPRRIEYFWAVSAIDKGRRTLADSILFDNKRDAKEYINDLWNEDRKDEDQPEIVRVGVFVIPDTNTGNPR